ncbi:MAG TPA: hypothetical protein VF042_02740 [Gemmatimonadaceae bacterium]
MPASEIIAAAADWTLSNDYARMSHYTDSNSVGELFVPAIAVPVVQKSEFECPREHLNTLKAMLPEVDRILAIGWASNEKHFLKLLRAGLTMPPSMCSVSGSEDWSKSTLENLMSSGFAFGRTHAFPMGFSEFIEQRAGKAFLNQSG